MKLHTWVEWPAKFNTLKFYNYLDFCSICFNFTIHVLAHGHRGVIPQGRRWRHSSMPSPSCRHHCGEALDPYPLSLGGNSRSVNRMTAAFLCRSPMGASFLEVCIGLRDQWMIPAVERCFMWRVDDVESQRRGTVESEQRMSDDGRA